MSAKVLSSRETATTTTNSNINVIGVDTVREALEQVFGILGSLQSQLGSDNTREPINKIHSEKAAVVGMQWYVEKCNALDEMTRKYRVKCQEYEQLLTRYNRLQSRKLENNSRQCRQQSGVQSGSYSAAAVGTARVATFDDIDEIEERMQAPGSARAKRTSTGLLVSPVRGGCRGGANAFRPATNVAAVAKATAASLAVAEEGTPTKRAKPSLFDGGDITDSFSSPPKPIRPAASSTDVTEKPAVAKKMPMVLVHSSQETQLDFSDPCFANEHAVKLCPDSDEEDSDGDRDKVMWTSPVRQQSSKPAAFLLAERERESSDSDCDSDARRQRQRLLEASGICDECKRFYSVPDLALPKSADLSLLCAHNRSSSKSGKGKGKDLGGLKNSVDQTPLSHGSNSGGRSSSRKQTPKSEQRLQSTPDYFWDISFFPDIKTAGPELLRKNRK
ncbi:hypothetical protein LPJ64_005671 [Coemansia asiatica]|uniref:Uncharacterized protein n=1 Tax=Coemansia asiatica TaxID=1052880 RepID=A0A9W7XGS2_9FUNG|nr:hypothetical protein LPJ64_005671 [Coemansia asiatica]